MKIHTDRTAIVVPGQHPWQEHVQPDGSVLVTITHDGVKTSLLLEPNEATQRGVSFIELGVAGRSLRLAAQGAVKVVAVREPNGI